MSYLLPKPSTNRLLDKYMSLPLHGLDLHLGQTVLPDGNVRSDTILAVVEEDDHAIRVHRLADEEFVVLEATNYLLSEGTSLGLEVFDLFVGGALFLELRLDRLHIACVQLALDPPWSRIDGQPFKCER